MSFQHDPYGHPKFIRMNPSFDTDGALGRRQAESRMQTRPEGAGPQTFEVLVRGELSEELVAELDARRINPRRGKTLILVDVIDQSHLHGVLGWFEDHNIEIERINPV
jgi:hypothetical protein